MATTKAPSWDLSLLYQGLNDPQRKKDRSEIEKRTLIFTKKYQGKIKSKKLTAATLKAALEEYEAIFEKLSVYSSFIGLKHQKNNLKEKIGQQFQASREFANQIYQQLLWFELEWIKVSDKKAKQLINHPQLKKFKHHLQLERVFKPFRLSAKEEAILVKKSLTSSSAFVRLYDQVMAEADYQMKINGKTKTLGLSELGQYLKSDPKREVRKQASAALSKGLAKNEKIYTYILNTLLHDKQIHDQIRGYQSPLQATLLGYEIDKKVVDNLTQAVVNSYHLCQSFYQEKKKLLSVKQLYQWDRYSPIFNKKSPKYTWQETKKIVLDSFYSFSNQFGQIAEMFFDQKRIDAQISKGKSDGAFCSYVTPNKDPFVLMNFTGEQSDITTLAHELGHGIHGYLSKKQNYLHFYPSTATAEMASTFCENIVFESVLNQIKDKKEKINLLAEKIQNSFATIFRQNAFYLFEQDLHQTRKEQGELSIKQVNQLYQKRLQSMFGTSLKLTDDHASWWMPVSHFYHYNFYVFTYVFGDLITSVIYNQYKNGARDFVKKYTQALSLGGSKTTKDTLLTIDIDIDNKKIWRQGLEHLQNLIKQFKKISAKDQ